MPIVPRRVAVPRPRQGTCEAPRPSGRLLTALVLITIRRDVGQRLSLGLRDVEHVHHPALDIPRRPGRNVDKVTAAETRASA